MKPEGHQTITQQAVGNLSFPFYLRHWLPNELPATAVQADRYLYYDSYAHFMRASATESSALALTNSIKWVRSLVLFATQQLYEMRRNFKIPAGNKGAWTLGGFTGHDSRNTAMSVPSAGYAPWAVAGPTSLAASAGESSIGRLQTLLETIHGRDPLYGQDTYKISFSIGFALHAMQDSYTARHAERCHSYAGPIVRLYEWDTVRDATLIGLFAENPTYGAKCNGEATMSHYESDLLSNWTGAQRQQVLAATQQLVLQIVRSADTAVDFADLKHQFESNWDEYRRLYLHDALEPDRPTRTVPVAPSAAINAAGFDRHMLH